MNTLRYGLVLLAAVACVAIYELRYAKVRNLAIFVTNHTLHLLDDEKDSDLKKAFGEKDGEDTENVGANGVLERVKRSIVNYGECPEGLIKLKVMRKLRCVTCDEYSELTGNDC